MVSTCDAVNAAHWHGAGRRPSTSAPPFAASMLYGALLVVLGAVALALMAHRPAA
jgi:hypothetical protein